MPGGPTADRVAETESACQELRDALRAVGVTLPSLGPDAVSSAGSVPLPLLDLGRCNVPTARALTAALREAADRTTARRRP
jgi:hypothetical protein